MPLDPTKMTHTEREVLGEALQSYVRSQSRTLERTKSEKRRNRAEWRFFEATRCYQQIVGRG